MSFREEIATAIALDVQENTDYMDKYEEVFKCFRHNSVFTWAEAFVQDNMDWTDVQRYENAMSSEDDDYFVELRDGFYLYASINAKALENTYEFARYCEKNGIWKQVLGTWRYG